MVEDGPGPTQNIERECWY